MKRLYFLIPLALVVTPLFAQLQFSASTNKSVYHYGDYLYIKITAKNTGSIPDTLVFGSSCEFNYFVDSINVMVHNHITCAAVIYSRIFAPNDSIEWGGTQATLMGFYIAPEILGIGKHAVIGRVEYYTMDTLWITVAATTDIEGDKETSPKYVLKNNYPNPFNPTTVISYQLPVRGYVTLKVYNVLGEIVATLISQQLHAGMYNATWDASGASSGMYYYRLQAGDFSQTNTMLLVK